MAGVIPANVGWEMLSLGDQGNTQGLNRWQPALHRAGCLPFQVLGGHSLPALSPARKGQQQVSSAGPAAMLNLSGSKRVTAETKGQTTKRHFRLTKGQNRAKLYIVKGPSGCRSVHAWLAAKGVEAVDNGREVLI